MKAGMAKTRAHRVGKRVAAAAAVVAVIALVWGAFTYRSAIRARLAPAEAPKEAVPSPAGAVADVYFADEEYTKLVAEKRDIAKAETPEERISAVVAELISGPRSPALSPTIPADAQLKSVFLRGDLALLNFDEHLRSKNFGSTGELFAVNSLFKTVTANVDGVDGIVILIEGSAYKTLAGEGGHVAAGFPIYGELGRYVYPPPKASAK
jgi:spore germination protein GerM